jgi:hypothetical protein
MERFYNVRNVQQPLCNYFITSPQAAGGFFHFGSSFSSSKLSEEAPRGIFNPLFDVFLRQNAAE